MVSFGHSNKKKNHLKCIPVVFGESISPQEIPKMRKRAPAITGSAVILNNTCVHYNYITPYMNNEHQNLFRETLIMNLYVILSNILSIKYIFCEFQSIY